MIVTIDGPAGSGKSTTARSVARRLEFGYLDSGALYRAVALKWLGSADEGGDGVNEPESVLADLDLAVRVRADGSLSFDLDGVDISDKIRSERVGSAASVVSSRAQVREYVTNIQRRFAEDLAVRAVSVVVEGRDIGTVVFPDADHKFFLDARPEIRAARRVAQLRSAGLDASETEVLTQIVSRDRRDRERAIAPLKPAADAYILDTSDLNEEKIVSIIVGIVRGESATT